MGKKYFLDSFSDTLLFKFYPESSYPVDLKICVLGFGFVLKDRSKKSSIAKLRALFLPPNNDENVCDVALIKMGAAHAEQNRLRGKNVEMNLQNSSHKLEHRFFIESDEEIERSYVFLDIEEL